MARARRPGRGAFLFVLLILVLLLATTFNFQRFSSQADSQNPSADFLPSGSSHLDRIDDIKLIQRLIWERQNPEDCSKARFLVLEPSAVMGLGALLHRVIPQLWAAVLDNRVLLQSAGLLGSYTTKENCASESFDCYFQAVSRCSLSDVTPEMFASGQAIRKVPPYGYLVDLNNLPPELGALRGRYGQAWYSKELFRYFTRPLPRLTAKIKELRQLSGLPEHGRYVGMHFRSGRILKTEGRRPSLLIYARTIARVSAQVMPITHVLFESDGGDAVMKELQRLLPPSITVHRVPPSVFAASRVPKGAFITSALDSLKKEAGGTMPDEGLAMLALLELLSGGDMFFGAFSSNLARVSYELMARRLFPPPVYEVDNDVWFAGSVSIRNTYCSQYSCQQWKHSRKNVHLFPLDECMKSTFEESFID